MSTITDKGTLGFLKFLQQTQPKIYAKVAASLLNRSPQNLNGLGDTYTTMGGVAVDPATLATATPPSSGLADTLSQLINTAAQTYVTVQNIDLQKQVLQAQLTRAQQGLPPLSVDQYGQPLRSSGLSSNVLLFGLLGLGAVLLLSRK